MQLSEAEIEKLRQSGVRLDGEGRFWHEGGEVTHAGMRAAFYRWLDRNEDGRWVLRLDEKRFVYLDVDDAPYVIRSVRWQGDHAIVRLSDDSEEELDYLTVRLRDGDSAYAIVKDGRFDARISTAAWGVLQAHVFERDQHVVLDAAGGPYTIAGF